MKEYYGLPEANDEATFTYEDGKRWFHTGDIGYWDEDDFFVVDREAHDRHRRLQRLSARSRGAPLRAPRRSRRPPSSGDPDERRGETVKAFIVPTPDAEATPRTSSSTASRTRGVQTPRESGSSRNSRGRRPARSRSSGSATSRNRFESGLRAVRDGTCRSTRRAGPETSLTTLERGRRYLATVEYIEAILVPAHVR